MILSKLRESLAKMPLRYWNTEIALRYLPVVDEIKALKGQTPSILEVGCGPRGITPYLRRRVVGLDVTFGPDKSPLITAVQGVCSELPFEDKSFDVVVSVDMMEHVPAELRIACVAEMVRVAKRKVVIAVPVDKASEAHDAKLDALYEEVHGQRHPFLVEHAENSLPSDKSMQEAFKKAMFGRDGTLRLFNNTNLRLRYFLMRLWIKDTRLTRALMRLSLLLLPLRRFYHFGQCYRKVYVADLSDAG
jgi:predicted SAM-dependent methyltransferase